MKKREPVDGAGASRVAPRHRGAPERTCVVCRTRRDKRALVRVARAPGGSVAVDATGKGAGRGAYVCASTACWEARGLHARLATALKTPLTDADRRALAAFAAGLAADGEGIGGQWDGPSGRNGPTGRSVDPGNAGERTSE